MASWESSPRSKVNNQLENYHIVPLRASKYLNKVVAMEVGGYIENIFRKGN